MSWHVARVNGPTTSSIGSSGSGVGSCEMLVLAVTRCFGIFEVLAAITVVWISSLFVLTIFPKVWHIPLDFASSMITTRIVQKLSMSMLR